MSKWQNYNDAEQQYSSLIPAGTIVPVVMNIKRGDYDDPENGWDGGYATYSQRTGSIYLNCQFTVTKGIYANRKIFSLIGLHSNKGPIWGEQGRSFIKAILNSSRGIMPSDNSQHAQTARCIHGFADLDGIKFIAKVEIEKDMNGQERNTIKCAIEPGHIDYPMVKPAAPIAEYSYAPPIMPYNIQESVMPF